MPKPKGVSVSKPTDDELVRYNEDRDLEAHIEQGLEPLADSPALNRLLLKNARKSYAEIAQITGLPANEVAERLTNLLNNTSWRDDLLEEKLLLAEMGMFMEDVRERMSRMGMDDEAWASMARVQLASFKTMLEQLSVRRKAVDGKLAILSMEQAKMFAEAIKLNNQLTVESLAAKYDLPEDVVYAEWEENFPRAVQMLESRIDN